MSAMKRRFKVTASANGKVVPKSARANASKSKRSIKAAESYGWVVEDSDAWDAYEFACDYFGKDYLDDQIVSGLSTEELAASLAFIFRMNEFREWDAYKNGEDYEEDDE